MVQVEICTEFANFFDQKRVKILGDENGGVNVRGLIFLGDSGIRSLNKDGGNEAKNDSDTYGQCRTKE